MRSKFTVQQECENRSNCRVGLVGLRIQVIATKLKEKVISTGWAKNGALFVETESGDQILAEAAVLADVWPVTCCVPKVRHFRNEVLAARRFDIFARDGFTCQLCGRKAGDGVALQCDHRQPRAHGGTDHDLNLQTLCADCNRKKKDSLSEDE